MNLLKLIFSKNYRKEISAKCTDEIISIFSNIEDEMEMLYKDIAIEQHKIAA